MKEKSCQLVYSRGLPHRASSSYVNRKPYLRRGFLWFSYFMSAPNPKNAHTGGTETASVIYTVARI